jgi:hypothetical protein
MKTLIISILALLFGPFAAFGQSTYQPFQPRQHTSTLGTPRSFEPQPYQQPIRQYQSPDVNIHVRPGYGETTRAYDFNTGYQLHVYPKSLGGYDIKSE